MTAPPEFPPSPGVRRDDSTLTTTPELRGGPSLRLVDAAERVGVRRDPSVGPAGPVQQSRAAQDLPAGDLGHVVRLAAAIFSAPIAAVSIVEAGHVRFAASHGLGISRSSSEPGLCASAVRAAEPYVVLDAATDARAHTHPLVVGEPFLRFYAAAPITTFDGWRVGAVFVADVEPREEVDDDRLAMLVSLAAVAAGLPGLDPVPRTGAPATCQLGGTRPCLSAPELRVADPWGDSAWGCVLHVEEVLLSGSSVFVADESMSGLAQFLRRGRR